MLAVEFAQGPCAKTLVAADDLRAGQIAGRAVGAGVKERWSCTYDAYVSFESVAAPRRAGSGWRATGRASRLSARSRTSRSAGSVTPRPAATTAMKDVLGTLAGKTKIIVVAV